jgi:hypothetical protein
MFTPPGFCSKSLLWLIAGVALWARTCGAGVIPGTAKVRLLSNVGYGKVYLVQDSSIQEMDTDVFLTPFRERRGPCLVAAPALSGVTHIAKVEQTGYAIAGGQLYTRMDGKPWEKFGDSFTDCVGMATDSCHELFVLKRSGEVFHISRPQLPPERLLGAKGNGSSMASIYCIQGSPKLLSQAGQIWTHEFAEKWTPSEKWRDDNVDLAGNDQQLYVLKKSGAIWRLDWRREIFAQIYASTKKVTQLVPTSNALYILEDGNVNRYDGEHWTPVPAGAAVRRILAVAKDQLLLVRDDGILPIPDPDDPVVQERHHRREKLFNDQFEAAMRKRGLKE